MVVTKNTSVTSHLVKTRKGKEANIKFLDFSNSMVNAEVNGVKHSFVVGEVTYACGMVFINDGNKLLINDEADRFENIFKGTGKLSCADKNVINLARAKFPHNTAKTTTLIAFYVMVAPNNFHTFIDKVYKSIYIDGIDLSSTISMFDMLPKHLKNMYNHAGRSSNIEVDIILKTYEYISRTITLSIPSTAIKR